VEYWVFGFVLRIPLSGEVAPTYEDRPCPDAPTLPSLALFCRSLWQVQCAITPFLQATCPSRSSGQNWLCLAHLTLLSCLTLQTSNLKLLPKLGLFRTVGPSRDPACLSGVANWVCFAHAALPCVFTSLSSAFKSSIINHTVPLPMLHVARIVTKFCARTRPPRRAKLCAQRNKEFLTRGVFYLLDCCTNVVGNANLPIGHLRNAKSRKLLFNRRGRGGSQSGLRPQPKTSHPQISDERPQSKRKRSDNRGPRSSYGLPTTAFSPQRDAEDRRQRTAGRRR
jgi:hypothetical protein